MFQIPLNSFNEDDKKIIKNVNQILSIQESELNSIDKIFIDYLRYIFWIEFQAPNFTLIKKMKDNNNFLYLKYLLEIFFTLFEKNKNEREALYKSKISLIGEKFLALFKSLRKLMELKKNSLNKNNLKDNILYIIYAYYYKNKNKTFPIFVTLYYFGLYLFIPKIKTPKLIIYHLLKENCDQIFDGLDYKEFIPDFDNDNCLYLVKLYFLNKRDNKNQVLPIYGYLIFRYKNIFMEHKKEIDFKLMQKTVVQILNDIISKNLNNKDIGKFINLNFINYLENNIKNEISENSNDNNISFKEKDKNIEINKTECDKSSKIIYVNKLANFQNKINNKNIITESSIKNDILKTNKDNTFLNDNAKKNDELIYKNNNIKETNNTDKKNISPKKDDDKKINNKIEKAVGENSYNIQKENLMKFRNDDSENANKKGKNISSELENNNCNFDEKTEKNYYNGSTERMSTKIENEDIFQDKNFEKENIEEREKEKDFLSQKNNLIQYSDNHALLKIKELEIRFNGMKIDKEKLESRFNEMMIDNGKIFQENKELKNRIKKIEEEHKLSVYKLTSDINQKENEIVLCRNNIAKNKEEIVKLKKNVKEIKTALGSIQVRDFAKSFLNQFRYLLTNEDKIKIESDRTQKWRIIFQRAEHSFQDYKKSRKYESIMEIFRKSVNIIEMGNNEAHNVRIKIYQDEINDLAKKYNILIPNSDKNKLFFLLQLGISRNLFEESYYFLFKYFNDEMKNYYLKDTPIKNFFY